MNSPPPAIIDVSILAVQETAGSALYGMIDVLSAAGTLWQTLVRTPPCRARFRVHVVSTRRERLSCGNRIPVEPDYDLEHAPPAPVVIVPELWLGPDESLRGRYSDVMQWLRRRHAEGAAIYSACSGSLMLAESGLLDGCEATSHWGYEDLFRRYYPKVKFRPAPTLAFADAEGRIVTAGGTTSWHDLALYIISRHISPGEALRIAQVYLMKLHSEGQLPYRALVRNAPHSDALVLHCQQALAECFHQPGALAHAVATTGAPERTLKRRFKAATGITPIEYLQNLRIEEAKRLLETGALPIDEVGYTVGYEESSFFRRLFKRIVGLTPGQYRRLLRPAANSEM